MESRDLLDEVIDDTYSVVDIVGIGTIGSQAINHLIDQQIKNINTIVIDSNKSTLDDSKATHKVSLSDDYIADNDKITKRQLVKIQEDAKKLFTSEFSSIIVFDIHDLNGVLYAGMMAKIAQEQSNHVTAVVYSSLYSGADKQVQTSISELNKIFDTIIVTSNTRFSNATTAQVTTGICSLEQFQLFFSLRSLLSALQYDFYGNLQHGIDHHDVVTVLSSNYHSLTNDKTAVPVTISSAVASKDEISSNIFQRAIDNLSFSCNETYSALIIVTINREYSLEEYEEMKKIMDDFNNCEFLIECFDISPQKNNEEDQVTILSIKNKRK